MREAVGMVELAVLSCGSRGAEREDGGPWRRAESREEHRTELGRL
jgi:hypothetical protein